MRAERLVVPDRVVGPARAVRSRGRLAAGLVAFGIGCAVVHGAQAGAAETPGASSRAEPPARAPATGPASPSTGPEDRQAWLVEFEGETVVRISPLAPDAELPRPAPGSRAPCVVPGEEIARRLQAAGEPAEADPAQPGKGAGRPGEEGSGDVPPPAKGDDDAAGPPTEDLHLLCPVLTSEDGASSTDGLATDTGSGEPAMEAAASPTVQSGPGQEAVAVPAAPVPDVTTDRAEDVLVAASAAEEEVDPADVDALIDQIESQLEDTSGTVRPGAAGASTTQTSPTPSSGGGTAGVSGAPGAGGGGGQARSSGVPASGGAGTTAGANVAGGAVGSPGETAAGTATGATPAGLASTGLAVEILLVWAVSSIVLGLMLVALADRVRQTA